MQGTKTSYLLNNTTFVPRANPSVKGPLQCNRPPHRWGLHLQLWSRWFPLSHDAACSPSPHSLRTSAPVCLRWRPLSPNSWPQVGPTAHVTDPVGHCGRPDGAQGGGGQEDQRGGEREGKKEERRGEERKQGTKDWGGDRGANKAVSGVAEWVGWRLSRVSIEDDYASKHVLKDSNDAGKWEDFQLNNPASLHLWYISNHASIHCESKVNIDCWDIQGPSCFRTSNFYFSTWLHSVFADEMLLEK